MLLQNMRDRKFKLKEKYIGRSNFHGLNAPGLVWVSSFFNYMHLTSPFYSVMPYVHAANLIVVIILYHCIEAQYKTTILH